MKKTVGGGVSRGWTKADLVEAVYRRHGGLTKNEASAVVETILNTVKTNLGEGRTIRIKNFGTFEVTRRAGRAGVNPASGEKIFIPEHTGLTFRPARNLKETIAPRRQGKV